MHVLLSCTATTTTTEQQQQQTLVTKKSSRSLDPFASVNNSYYSCKSFPGLFRVVNNQTVDFGNNAIHIVPCCKLNIVPVASFPCTPHPAFCHLPFCKQQEVRGQSEKDSTQSTLWILSPRKVAYAHEVQKHPSRCNLLGIQI